MVEGYQMTAQGLRKLGSGTVEAAEQRDLVRLYHWRLPSLAAIQSALCKQRHQRGERQQQGRGPAKQTAKEIADELKIRFQQEGWISRENPTDSPEPCRTTADCSSWMVQSDTNHSPCRASLMIRENTGLCDFGGFPRLVFVISLTLPTNRGTNANAACGCLLKSPGQ